MTSSRRRVAIGLGGLDSLQYSLAPSLPRAPSSPVVLRDSPGTAFHARAFPFARKTLQGPELPVLAPAGRTPGVCAAAARPRCQARITPGSLLDQPSVLPGWGWPAEQLRGGSAAPPRAPHPVQLSSLPEDPAPFQEGVEELRHGTGAPSNEGAPGLIPGNDALGWSSSSGCPPTPLVCRWVCPHHAFQSFLQPGWAPKGSHSSWIPRF